MAKPNYQYEKRQRELEKKRKKAEKEKRKAEQAQQKAGVEGAEPDQDTPPPAPEE